MMWGCKPNAISHPQLGSTWLFLQGLWCEFVDWSVSSTWVHLVPRFCLKSALCLIWSWLIILRCTAAYCSMKSMKSYQTQVRHPHKSTSDIHSPLSTTHSPLAHCPQLTALWFRLVIPMLARKNVVLAGRDPPSHQWTRRQRTRPFHAARSMRRQGAIHNDKSLPAGWVVTFFAIPQAEFCQVRFSKCGIGMIFWDIIAILWFNCEDVLVIKCDICIQLTLWIQWMVVKHLELPVFLLPFVVFVSFCGTVVLGSFFPTWHVVLGWFSCSGVLKLGIPQFLWQLNGQKHVQLVDVGVAYFQTNPTFGLNLGNLNFLRRSLLT